MVATVEVTVPMVVTKPMVVVMEEVEEVPQQMVVETVVKVVPITLDLMEMRTVAVAVELVDTPKMVDKEATTPTDLENTLVQVEVVLD
jgi:hypothetical protein